MTAEMDQEIPLQAPVTGLCSDEYDRQVYVATQSNEILILQTSTNSVIGKMSVSNGTPQCVSCSAGAYGPMVAVGCSNGSIVVFQNGREIQTFNSTGAILSVAFHKSQCKFAAASLDGTFSVYTCTAGKWNSVSIPVSCMGLTSICWGSEGDKLQTLIVGGVDGAVRVYKSAGGQWEASAAAQVHDGWVRVVSAPNVPLGACQKIATCGDDGKACVVKVMNNQAEISEINGLRAAGSVAWAMVDKTVVVCHTDGAVTMWKESGNGDWTSL